MSARAHYSSRRRSHSPAVDQTSPSRHHRRQRSASPPSHRSHRAHTVSAAAIVLPFQAQPLSRGDLERLKPMFGLYLDIQKHLVLEDLEEKEVKGRWKRFVGKWNRGELAEGWYDPATLQRAQASVADNNHYQSSPPANRSTAIEATGSEDDGDDTFGPVPISYSYSNNPPVTTNPGKPSGPSIPTFQDLALQREDLAESSLLARQDLRHARKADRLLQKSQLEDLAPRAQAGTKDRLLERKADVRLANNTFAASKSENTFADVPDADLMGDEEGGSEGFKKRKVDEERKKNEREIRREEILRARTVEREERVRVYKEKEARTMEGLVALAKARFG
ncbi:MAG: hypothetical protein Q9181_003725 [Wetmoreana brouardii]